MKLEEIVNQPTKQQWLLWKDEDDAFLLVENKPWKKRANRETLSRVYMECVHHAQNRSGASYEEASQFVRALWTEERSPIRSKTLPGIIGEDGFLQMYALGLPCPVDLAVKLWKRAEKTPEETSSLQPIYVEWNEPAIHYYDVDATPPGLLSKFSTATRIKKDKALLERIAQDLEQIAKQSNPKKRLLLSLAVLSHGAAYRELSGCVIRLPSLSEVGKLIPYQCEQHLIAEGVKTISLVPKTADAFPIYLCQGTEFWPSQPSMLGSIMANFGEHGSATAAYAHSWRRIHQHLRQLGKPIVAGHSMGGALAMQIGLYSHDLVDSVFAFNPPMPNERDYHFFHQMSEESKKKIQVIANLDDFAFWRIGAKVIGDVTLYLGKQRWEYYSVNVWDCVCLLPAFVKFIRNVHHAFPAHQRIAALYENWVSFKLTQEEIEKENVERTKRFDYLHFLPKLYDPSKVLLTHLRKIFKWKLQEEYLRNEIEILALHERDLIDTLTDANREEIEKELTLLRSQKNELIHQLLKKHP